MKLTPATFVLPGANPDQDELEYEGHRFPDEDWNGWAIPEFEKEVAEKILQDGNYKYRFIDHSLLAIFDEEFGEEEVQMYARTINGKQVFTYGVGARYWVWDLKTTE